MQGPYALALMASIQDPVTILTQRFQDAAATVFEQIGDARAFDPQIRPCNQPEHGDFQCNAAMSLAKRVGKPPREVAKALIANVKVEDLCEPMTEGSIAGPGFINLRLRGDALAASLAGLDAQGLGIAPPERVMNIVVDLMGVNLSKQMHVGHLRSPIIGDAIAKTFERIGHRVIRQNHVGDWGLPIAMVTARLMEMVKSGTIDLAKITLDQLDAAYKAAQAECQRETGAMEMIGKFNLGPKLEAEVQAQIDQAMEKFTKARATLLALQAKEPETYAVWKRIQKVTMDVCIAVCERLHVNVTDEHSAGESSYADELAGVVADLEQRGIAEKSDGALIVRIEEPEFGGIKEPCLIRKTDGGFLYATTDVAAIKRRVQKLEAERIVYCIDARQSLQMKQVYGVSKKAGYTKHPKTGEYAVLEHAAFGSVLGEDGKPFKTRSGESTKLSDLLEETVTRATAVVLGKNSELSPQEARVIAEGVGMAALKYADLCNDRIRDYIFSFDRMLAFEGNTGPYLLYALVRTKNIFRKAAEKGIGDGWKSAAVSVTEPAEKALALGLLKYPSTVKSVADSLEPHRLCQYLFELAGLFSSFYDQCPVLSSEGAVRDGRLRLASLTGRVLEDGLGILGIPTLERM